MKVFYLNILVKPNSHNTIYSTVEGAVAHCWILEELPDTAYRKAIFYIKKDNWEIDQLESYPLEVKRMDFINKDLGLENYDKAIEKGMAFAYVGWSRDGKTSLGPVQLSSLSNFDLEKYLSELKREQKNGCCLHYDAGISCNTFIKAHSIQNKGLLNLIQHNGQVYQPNANISILKKNRGKISYKKKVINKVSTFRGFCQKHDNELFKPIDASPLIPTDQQVFLYAYRSLCRELFVKENALRSIKSQLEKTKNKKAVEELFKNLEIGTLNGLKSLKLQKARYDHSLKLDDFGRIKYSLFISDQRPNIVFSSIIAPDYDFLGRQLQNLADTNLDLELITYCSAPLENGWGFLFAWHESSYKIGLAYLRSLATAVHMGKSIEDFLFRLAISSENHAISPLWWENKSEHDRNEIEIFFSNGLNIFSKVHHNYLMKDLERISDWKFNTVINNY